MRGHHLLGGRGEQHRACLLTQGPGVSVVRIDAQGPVGEVHRRLVVGRLGAQLLERFEVGGLRFGEVGGWPDVGDASEQRRT